MIEALLATFLIIALVYSAGGWLVALAMHLSGKLAATTELDEHMFRLGVCAILAGGFLYLGANL